MRTSTVKLTIIILLVLASTTNISWASSFQERRERMVDDYIVDPAHGVPVTDSSVISSMKTVPRHQFVKSSQKHRAYENTPLPIGYGQTISQPFIVGLMTQALRLSSGDTVLEIGSGSGYQAAVLGEIVSRVYTIEIIPELAQKAKKRLDKLGYENITIKQGDGYYGWEEHAPYDAIIVTAAPSSIPPPLLSQLKNGGRMVIPVGPPLRTQQLIVVKKRKDGDYRKKTLLPVSFVPFRRSPNQ